MKPSRSCRTVKAMDRLKPCVSTHDRHGSKLNSPQCSRVRLAARLCFSRVRCILSSSFHGLTSTRSNAEFFEALPDLRCATSAGAGYNGVDTEDLGKAGIWFANTPDAVSTPTAVLASTLILSCIRFITHGDRIIRRGDWTGPSARGDLKMAKNPHVGADVSRWTFSDCCVGAQDWDPGHGQYRQVPSFSSLALVDQPYRPESGGAASRFRFLLLLPQPKAAVRDRRVACLALLDLTWTRRGRRAILRHARRAPLEL
jgi:hypothetical protein